MIQALQLILSLGILVALHEFGHFAAARIFKIRVERFYLFFDFLFPLPNVLNFALWKKKIGDTEYGLGWFPMGGYVKIAGMVDESMDLEQMAQEPQPWEFRSKPAWQRLIVMLGGIIVNIILGVFIFINLTFFMGKRVLPMSEINKTGIVAYELGELIGLKTGDKILALNGEPVIEYSDVLDMNKVLDDNSYYTVERNGAKKKVYIPSDFADILAENSRKDEPARFIDHPWPFAVDSVLPNMNAEKAGLKKGDKIIDVAANKISYFHELQNVLKINKGKKVSIKVDRNGEIKDLQAQIDKNGKIGFAPKSLLKDSAIYLSYSESMVVGTKEAFGIVFMQAKGISKIFSGQINPKNSVGSVVSIAKQFPTEWSWPAFWMLTGLLSMALAFMNFLPIPALDGGHVVFLLYEMITGRKPSDKFLEGAQKVGTVLLLTLMVYALSNDITNIFMK